MNFTQSRELREKRANLVELNKQCLAQISAEKDAARIKELEGQWDARDAELEAIGKQIERAEKQEKLEAEMEAPVKERRSGRMQPDKPKTPEQREADKTRYRKAYWDALRFGAQELDPEDQILLRNNRRELEPGERRAMSTTVAAGGYTIPEGFFNELQVNMLAFGGMRSVSRVITTASGNALPIPTVDDTSQEAQIIGEGSALTSPQDPTFGVVTLNAFMYRTLCLLSLELLQDSAFDMEVYIRQFIAERFARGQNRHFTTGNGSTQPNGIVPATNSGKTFTSATTLSYSDMVDLEHSLDPAYRALPGTGWMFADSTLKILKKLLDSQNRPLWVPGMAVREPNTLLGYPYTINQNVAAVAASNKSVLFGNFPKYLIRDVSSSMLIVRANELHIGNGQVGFYAFMRTDADLLDAGTDPVKHGTHPSPD